MVLARHHARHVEVVNQRTHAAPAGIIECNRRHVPQLAPGVAPVVVVLEELEAPVEVADHRLREREPSRVIRRQHRARVREFGRRDLAASAETAHRVAVALDDHRVALTAARRGASSRRGRFDVGDPRGTRAERRHAEDVE